MTAPKAGWTRVAVIGADGKLKAPEPKTDGWITFDEAWPPQMGETQRLLLDFDYEGQFKRSISACGISAKLLAEIDAFRLSPINVSFEPLTREAIPAARRRVVPEVMPPLVVHPALWAEIVDSGITQSAEPRQRSIIYENASRDPDYSPYCGRCSGLHRMTKVEPFYWRHHCGAEHDERG